ncbi:uncharacterized protein K02A2.6-like [Armigeres subalbatus]|uniref:uncharacterized protein K02A2.6-like n=1 Tax=Armigeres subalbatus TaxID=124917 RepID=UPI002ED346FE
MRLINKLNESAELTLQQVVEQCNSLVNLKQDTVLVESCSSAVNAVAFSKRKKPKHRSPSDSSNNRDQPKTPCWSCGGMHFNKDCRFRDHRCNNCGRHGHREGYCACFSSKTSHTASNHPDKFNKRRHQPSAKAVSVRTIGNRRKFVELQINNVPLRLQLDTGSDISIISHQSWIKIGQPKAKSVECTARTASGEPLHLMAELECNITFNGTTSEANQRIVSLQTQCAEVFTNEMGLCNKSPVKLVLKGDPKPVFRPKRPVPYSMKQVVENELIRLQILCRLKKVDFIDHTAPIVEVRKPNGTVRICADYSTGHNSVLEPNQYPLPLPEDIFAKMANCRIFSHVDLSDAYLQVEVDQSCQPLLTINTHKGLFQYTRLSPGIKSAPGAFQQLMDTMLADLEYTVGYLDDILVGGRNEEEHQRNLQRTLQRLKKYGFTVRIEKCSFGMQQVKHLGQILDGSGIRPDPGKISAIVSMPPPHDVSSLRSYLGAINYYGKYVKEMRTLRHPMDQLLKAGANFEWSPACQASFDRFREILQSPLLLTHYNPNLGIIVSADASAFGLGARIAHQFPDGTVKAVYHVSRSLTAAEWNYSQVEKEGLALIFAVTRFHRMLFGRKFILETDHKPLLSIFGSKKGIPTYTANRLQRWALTLLLYDFDIRYISTENFGYADVLSRLINRHIRPDEEIVIANLEMESSIRKVISESDIFPLSFKMVQAETKTDDTLQQVIRFVNTSWPSKKKDLSDLQIQQYYLRRDSLTIVDNCLMYGERLVIPPKFRKRVLKQLPGRGTNAIYFKTSNGLAERFVNTFKRSLKKITAGEALDEAIDIFLQCYRSTPCRSAPDGKSPAELLVGRPVRTSLDFLRPPSQFYTNKHPKQEDQYNRKHGTKSRTCSPHDLIWAKVFRNNKWTWEAGSVVERLGEVMYNVWLETKQQLIRSHCNQLRTRHQSDGPKHSQTSEDIGVPLDILLDGCGLNTTTDPEYQQETTEGVPPEHQQRSESQKQHHPSSNIRKPPISTRQSTRIRRPPVRYEPYQLF